MHSLFLAHKSMHSSAPPSGSCPCSTSSSWQPVGLLPHAQAAVSEGRQDQPADRLHQQLSPGSCLRVCVCSWQTVGLLPETQLTLECTTACRVLRSEMHRAHQQLRLGSCPRVCVCSSSSRRPVRSLPETRQAPPHAEHDGCVAHGARCLAPLPAGSICCVSFW